MNYEEFKKKLVESIKEYLPEEYKEAEVEVNQIMKVNCTLDALILKGLSEKVAPTIYINHMYEYYRKTEDFEETVKMVANIIEDGMKTISKVGHIDFSNTEDKIIFQLINTEQNKEMFEKGVPHREFKDLSIIYRYVVKAEEHEIQSAIITIGLQEHIGMSEKELYKAAVENTRRILPPTVKSMKECVYEMLPDIGECPEQADFIMNMMLEEMPDIWVISNDRHINGATSMLYEDVLYELSNTLGSDLYILPASTHEVMVIKAIECDPLELAQMVTQINMEQVELTDRLSNQVYYYSRDLRKVTLATDTPNKRLDMYGPITLG